MQLPIIRELRARGLLLPVGVGLAVLTTLLHGAWSREPFAEARPAADGAAADPEPTPYPAPPELLQTLRPGLEKTPLSYHSDYWRQLGEITRPKLVLIGGFPGVVLMRGLALTSLQAAEPILAERRRELARASREEEPEELATGSSEHAPDPPGDDLIGVDVEIGAALFRVDEARASIPFAHGDAEPGAGALLAAVSLTPDGTTRVSPGHMVSTSGRPHSGGDLDAAIPMPADSSAAAIVNLDGGLVGVALVGESVFRLWSYDRIARVVARLASDSVCQSLEVVSLAPEVLERLGLESGVLVERVYDAAYAPRASIRPGDVLVEWNDATLRQPQQFATRYRETPPGSQVRYRVLRGRRTVTGVTIMPAPDCRPVGEPGVFLETLGVQLSWQAAPDSGSGWRVQSVSAASPARAAGLAPGDRILAVDGGPIPERSVRPFDGFERRGEDALLTVRTRDRVRLVLVHSGG